MAQPPHSRSSVKSEQYTIFDLSDQPDLETVSISSLASTDSDNYWYQVLGLCDQTNPLPFGVEFCSSLFQDFEYLDSGTYSHVIKAVHTENDNTSVVFKIIKVLHRSTKKHLSNLPLGGCELYQDAYQEIVIVKLLSNLYETVCDPAGYKYQAHSFPRIFRTRIVHGDMPSYFTVCKIDKVAKVKTVERFDELLGVPKENLVIMMKFGGDSLWDRVQLKAEEKCLSPEQILSVCYQVTVALAVAEAVYQFEHRDLHVSNILVKGTSKKYVTFMIKSRQYRAKSFGIKACIIDATFSRLCMDGQKYYTHLSQHLKGPATSSHPNGQDEAYNKMYHLIGDRWSEWFPVTNIIWLRYFFSELLNSDAFKQAANPQEEDELRGLIDTVGNFEKVFDFLVSGIRPGGPVSRTSAEPAMSRF